MTLNCERQVASGELRVATWKQQVPELQITNRQFPISNFQFPIADCQLTIRYQLSTINYQLSAIAHRTVSTTHHSSPQITTKSQIMSNKLRQDHVPVSGSFKEETDQYLKGRGAQINTKNRFLKDASRRRAF